MIVGGVVVADLFERGVHQGLDIALLFEVRLIAPAPFGDAPFVAVGLFGGPLEFAGWLVVVHLSGPVNLKKLGVYAAPCLPSQVEL